MSLKNRSIFLLLFIAMFFCLFPVTYAQLKQYSPKVSTAVETYAFLRGQDAAIREVSKQFPNLENDAEAVKMSLKFSFGRAEENIVQFLKEELNDSHFKLLQKQIDSLLQQQFKNPIEKEQYARDFLAKANQRLHSMSDTIMHKRIISFIYHNAPHEEIKDGYLNFFETENHPKAQLADIKIPIPKSWVAEEATNPQTIQQFTSCNGTGIEKLVITAYDLPESRHNVILTKSSVSEMLSPQSNLIRSEAVAIDGIPAMMIEVEESFISDATAMKIRMLQFMFVLDKRLYCIQGSVGPVQSNRNLEMHFKKYEPMFRLVAANTEIDTD